MAQPIAASGPASTSGVRTPWRISVHNIEACNCTPGCNCQFTGFPDRGNCEAMIGGEVREGSFGDVSLAGVRYVIAFIYPKAIHEGAGNVALFIDDRASLAQAEAIATILSGRAGGMPFEALAGTYATVDGPIRAPIGMTVDGTRSSFRSSRRRRCGTRYPVRRSRCRSSTRMVVSSGTSAMWPPPPRCTAISA
jgi:hypothetical protein